MKSASLELLTLRETAQMLRVTPITVRRYIAAGHLPAVKVGKGIRVPKKAVGELIRPIAPRKAAQRRRLALGKPTSADDPLWNIIGLARGGGGATHVSENKYEYLADIYADMHE